MNIDRYEALTLEYRANANSTVLILHRHTRLLESQSQNQSVVAVVKFVRSPGENNKRAICKRASVGEERQNAGDRERKIERASERTSEAEGGMVYIFQIEMLTQ